MGGLNDWSSSTVTANQGARPARTSHAQANDRWDSREVLQRVCGGRVCECVCEYRTEKQSQRPTRKNFQWTQPWLEKVKWKKWKKWKQAEGRDVDGRSPVQRDI